MVKKKYDATFKKTVFEIYTDIEANDEDQADDIARQLELDEDPDDVYTENSELKIVEK